MSKRGFLRTRATTSAVVCAGVLALTAIAAPPKQRPLALTNITIVDVLSGAPRRPATVLINNGRILEFRATVNWRFRPGRR